MIAFLPCRIFPIAKIVQPELLQVNSFEDLTGTAKATGKARFGRALLIFSLDEQVLTGLRGKRTDTRRGGIAASLILLRSKSSNDRRLGLSSAWPGKKTTVSETKHVRVASRKIVWVEEHRFRGFACSECQWRFDPSAAPKGESFEEMMRNFQLQRDREFTSHVCADHPRTMGAKRSS
jgi:hypothetical protein